MNGHQSFWSLVKHDLSFRRERSTDEWMGRRRWVVTVPGLLIWVAVVTWQGPHIHFNLNYAWYAALAVPIIAVGMATGHIAHEQKNGTAGWWLTLPRPRWQLVLSKWLSACVLMVRTSWYLVSVAALGVYTMALNGTLSTAHVTSFLVVGLTWAAVMYCLVPLMAAVGVLIGTMDFSRLKDLSWAVWLLVGAAAWIAVGQYGKFFVVSRVVAKYGHFLTAGRAAPMAVTLKSTFGLGIAGTLVIAAGVLWIATRILNGSTGM